MSTRQWIDDIQSAIAGAVEHPDKASKLPPMPKDDAKQRQVEERQQKHWEAQERLEQQRKEADPAYQQAKLQERIAALEKQAAQSPTKVTQED